MRNILLVLAAIAGLAVLAFVVLTSGMCGSDTVEPSRSPSGTYGVRVETSGCGATTANTTEVAVTRANWPRSRRALFRITPSGAPSEWTDAATAPMRFRWEGDSVLVVEHLPSVPPPQRPPRVFDVAVRYVALAR